MALAEPRAGDLIYLIATAAQVGALPVEAWIAARADPDDRARLSGLREDAQATQRIAMAAGADSAEAVFTADIVISVGSGSARVSKHRRAAVTDFPTIQIKTAPLPDPAPSAS